MFVTHYSRIYSFRFVFYRLNTRILFAVGNFTQGSVHGTTTNCYTYIIIYYYNSIYHCFRVMFAAALRQYLGIPTRFDMYFFPHVYNTYITCRHNNNNHNNAFGKPKGCRMTKRRTRLTVQR